jgi:hypothetical protein
MRSINIDSLSEAELIELNHKIVACLRFLGQMRSHSVMLDFRIGEKVKFRPTGRPELIGTLTRYNKKNRDRYYGERRALECRSGAAFPAGFPRKPKCEKFKYHRRPVRGSCAEEMNSLGIVVPHPRYLDGEVFDFSSIISLCHVFLLEICSLTGGHRAIVRARIKECNARSSGLPLWRWDW